MLKFPLKFSKFQFKYLLPNMSQESKSDNKRIAKNTIYLFIRMLFTMSVNLYASRLILDILGEEDYGLYNIVGGFVAMFGMINMSLTATTQRFLSYEIGKDRRDIKTVFSTSILIHIIVALAIILLAETFGLWFINNKLNIPSDRYAAANWVYQLSLITLFVNIISVPYNAALIAFEKMKAFAYVSVVESGLKLLIVYLLLISFFDKLIIYSALLTVVAIAIRILYSLYVRKNLKDCINNWSYNKDIGKEMLVFAGWNTFGAASNILGSQGLNIILNIFYGVTINAARGVAFQVLNAVQSLVGNFQLAMNPQIVKLYSSGDKEGMFNLVFRGSRYSFILLMFLVIPLFLEAPYVLSIWLVNTPSYTDVFLRIILVTALINTLGITLSYSMLASGIVRNYQIAVNTTTLLSLPIAYFLSSLGMPPYGVFIISLIFAQIGQFVQIIMLRKSIQLPAINFFIKVCLRSWGLFVFASLVPTLVYLHLDNSSASFLIVCLISILSCACVAFFAGLNKKEQVQVYSIIKKKVFKR